MYFGSDFVMAIVHRCIPEVYQSPSLEEFWRVFFAKLDDQALGQNTHNQPFDELAANVRFPPIVSYAAARRILIDPL